MGIISVLADTIETAESIEVLEVAKRIINVYMENSPVHVDVLMLQSCYLKKQRNLRQGTACPNGKEENTSKGGFGHGGC